MTELKPWNKSQPSLLSYIKYNNIVLYWYGIYSYSSSTATKGSCSTE